MMRITYVFMIVILGFSCQSLRELPGEYFKETKDYRYDLKMNLDSTFILKRESYFSLSGCIGKWEVVGYTLLLKCDEEPLGSQLSSGYMTDRKLELMVLRNGNLKYNEVVLKRKK